MVESAVESIVGFADDSFVGLCNVVGSVVGSHVGSAVGSVVGSVVGLVLVAVVGTVVVGGHWQEGIAPLHVMKHNAYCQHK